MYKGAYFVLVLTASLFSITKQECKNNTAIKYDLSQPSQILHYYSMCSLYAKRTCCSPKNIQTLTKKIKRVTDSNEISSLCKSTISNIMCSACDGDWVFYGLNQGQGLYEGICPNKCQQLYLSCQNDYFVLQPAAGTNGKLRVCKEEDWVCWKLKDILANFYVDIYKPNGQSQICGYFDLLGTQNQADCWKGQISSQYKGKGKNKIQYKAPKNPKRVKRSWFERNSKQIIYTIIILTLILGLVYKLCKPKQRPHYYRLD